MSEAVPPAQAPQTPPPGLPEGRSSLRQIARDLLALDRLTVAILVTVPISMTLLDYYGMPWHYGGHEYTRRPGRPHAPLSDWVASIQLPGPAAIRPYLWWGIACLVLLVGLPMLVGAALRTSPRKFGLRLKGTGPDAVTYALLYVIFLPVIWLVSRTAAFQHTYPFYPRPPEQPGILFLVFEVAYCAQFFAIEFFFRGFMVLGLKPKLGGASVLVMLAPYCMIHYYKPMPEALGAIGAGLVLGVLAWRTGTIIYGWFLHYAVALSMDLLALAQSGRLHG